LRTIKAAVIWLGIMESAVLYNLRKNGVDAWGFDPLFVGEMKGSFHGLLRVPSDFIGGPGRTRTCNQTVMSGRISICFVDLLGFRMRLIVFVAF
jgi:hypothetical protein